MPLVRLQGVIDAQGLDMLDMSALPPELLAETQARIDELREPELALKRRGRWGESDLLGYTADRLRAIDRLVYSPTHFDDVTDVEQLARVEITNGSVAVVCRSKAGIYEVERQLRRLHGKRLGVIVLRTGSAAYPLRQVKPFLPGLIGRGAGAPSGLAASPAQFSVLLVTLGGALLLIRGLRAPGLYGLRRPAGLDWCILLPSAIFGALAGGVWNPVPATTPVP